MERRLAAIFVADVVGYVRLMREDEAGTLDALRTHRRQLIEPKIAEHEGRIVKLMGDGLLAEFSSVVEAVQCAVEIQQDMYERNSDVPEDRRMAFRIGVNLGDVIVEGNDIHGHGVNLAARLEGLAKPGGVCISGTTYDTIQDKLALAFEDMGKQAIKNIAEPVRVYGLRTPGPKKGAPGTLDEGRAAPDKPSVAVLPFANLSGDPEQEYFSDGITEDIITELSRFRELLVVSRNSSIVFKGMAVSAAEVAEKLGVQYLVEGSIRKAGNRVRVTAQLIDARTNTHIWADRYDRELEDIFEVQDDVVTRVTSTLVGRLEHERQERAKRQSKDQLRAYDLYLRGREHIFNWSPEENQKACDLLQAAIDIEPDYAAAQALFSESLLRAWLNGWSERPDEDLADSYRMARTAVELDDGDSRTHTSLGLAYIFRRELDKAKYHFETALRLNPNDTRVLAYYSRQAVFDGDHQRAIDLGRRALQLNPYGKYYWNIGLVHFVARQYDEAIRLLRSTRNPAAVVLAVLAASHAMTGEAIEAKSTCERFLEEAESTPGLRNLKDRDEWREYFSARWPFRNADDLEHLFEGFRKAGLPI